MTLNSGGDNISDNNDSYERIAPCAGKQAGNDRVRETGSNFTQRPVFIVLRPFAKRLDRLSQCFVKSHILKKALFIRVF